MLKVKNIINADLKILQHKKPPTILIYYYERRGTKITDIKYFLLLRALYSQGRVFCLKVWAGPDNKCPLPFFQVQKGFLQVWKISLVSADVDYNGHIWFMAQGAYKGLSWLSETEDPYIGLEFNGREYLLLFLCYAKKYVAQDSHKPCVGISLCFELCAYIGVL